ncbi:alpha/beta fold hydrolase [Nonomuraea sp. NPDC059023]|uniref:alpha/beta fold hydrolase n=1 Tax=unclassified Nonomuraea TaxID=2593643 RepID=UPI0036A6A0A5
MTKLASADGTLISYESIGTGPGIVVLGGGRVAGRGYRALAWYLADSFTVHLLDRDTRLAGYSIDRVCDDVITVMAETGSTRLFGHSSGGLVALETALRHPVEKLAAYEPAVSVNGGLPRDWLPAFERALAEGRTLEALARQIKGLEVAGSFSRLPLWLIQAMIALTLRGERRQGYVDVLPRVPAEMREVLRLDSDGLRYRDTAAETLLLTGERGPAYLLSAAAVLNDVIPAARLVELPGLTHDAPNDSAPAQVAHAMRGFFAA